MSSAAQVAMDTKIFDCGLKFTWLSMYLHVKRFTTAFISGIMHYVRVLAVVYKLL